MSLSYYFDHHVPRAVARGLRRREIEVLTASDDGRAQTLDEHLLAHATELGRVLVSNDRGFLGIASRWYTGRRTFAGLVVLTDQHTPHGTVIADLQLIAEAYTAEEMINRIEYVPL